MGGMPQCYAVLITQDLVEIRNSQIDRRGGFATADIISGALVLEYVGQRIDKTEAQRRCDLDNRYIFFLDEDWDIDGDVPENPARFLNHSCAPNCEAQGIAGQIWIVAIEPIRAGEELTFNYGYDLEAYREHPCLCGARDCVGYIVAEEHFEHVRAQNQLRQAAGS